MRFDSFYKDISETELINEGINDLGIFKAVFMAGFPGSGKSYTLSKVKSGLIEPRMVNVDLYVEFKDPHGGHYEEFYNRSRILLESKLTLYINSVLPLAIDTTSAQSTAVVRRYNILENLGYDLGMIFVNTSSETAWDRIQKRTRKVDRESFENYYNQIKDTKNFLKSKFPFYIEVSNDVGELTNEVVLDAFKKVSYFYDSPIKNPIGKEYFDLMKRNGWKYLAPSIMTMSQLKRKVSDWYRSV